MIRTLRVLHIASGDLWAGAEVQAFTLMAHLVQIAHTEVAAVLMNEGTLAGKLRLAGIPLYVLNEREIGFIRIFTKLRGVLNAWRPDVIHTHREKENILGSLANGCCRNVPSVRTLHGAKEHSRLVGWRGARRRVVEGVDRWCGCFLQDRVITVTRDLAGKARAEFPAEKIVAIENGIDVQAVRRERGVADFRAAAPGCTHIGYAGRLVEVKRLDLFIEAATLLSEEHPERSWRFHVFGDGPLRTSLEHFSKTTSIADIIVFHGYRQDIATCLAGLDALVMCSDHEGMPMVALEAAALDVPVVAHAVGGLVDVVPQQFLVTRHNAQGYRDGILRALREDAHAITESRASEVLPKFSARRNAERIHSLYRQVVAEHGGKYGSVAG